MAAAVGFGVGATPLRALGRPEEEAADALVESEYTLVKGSALQTAEGAIGSGSGSKGLASPKSGAPFTVVIMAEEKKSPAEFEWHERRDHIFTILDGTTKVELGGTPSGAHQPKPGEWLATGSDGAKAVMLEKGDVLCIPRGTPHKRSTESRVVFQVISVELPAKA